MKKLKLATMVLGAILLSGCGGGGSESTTDKIKKRNGIAIYHNTNQCTYDNIEPNVFINPSIYQYDNTVSCSTFKRGHNSDYEKEFCREYDSEFGGNIACVIAFDDFVSNKSFKAVASEKALSISNGFTAQ